MSTHHPNDVPRRGVLAAAAGLAAAVVAGCSSARHAVTSPARTSPRGTPPSSPGPGPAPSTATAVPTTALADVEHGPRTVPAVALTFHGAGDPATARSVLAETAAAGAHVTVLAVGTWLETNPGMARAILDGGHDLGNHTYRHLPMRTMSAGTAVTEVARCADLLRRLTGSHGSWFRPSGIQHSTARIRAAALHAGYDRCLSYDLDSLDYTDPGSAAVVSKVLREVRDGSIVSLHLGHPGTVEAMPSILDGLARRGLRAVTVTDLLRTAP